MQVRVETYPRAAVERAMKIQEVILRAMAKKITWWQAAEILGISDRSAGGAAGPAKSGCQWRWWSRCWGFTGRGIFDLNVRHFH